MFIQKDLIYKIRHGISVNNDTEALYFEIINQKSTKNLLTLFTDSHLEIKKIFKIILVNFSKKQKPR